MNHSNKISDMTGTWNLIDWICKKEGEFHTYPMEEDVVGQLIYTCEGRMSGFLMRNDFKNQKPRTPASSAISLSYAGNYRIEGDEVIHDVLMATIPEWIGTPLVRTIIWKGGDLLLKTEPQPAKDGYHYSNELLWRRLLTA